MRGKSVLRIASLTPVWTAYDFVVAPCAGRRGTCDTKVCQLDASVLVREDVRTFDISVDDISLMEVIQPEEDLSNPVTD